MTTKNIKSRNVCLLFVVLFSLVAADCVIWSKVGEEK
jgi:hypothetical protein